MTDITQSNEVWVSTSKNGDYVQATFCDEGVKFTRTDLAQAAVAAAYEAAAQVAIGRKGFGSDAALVHPYDKGYVAACDAIATAIRALATPDQIAALAAVRAATVTVKPLVWEDIAPRHSKAALPLFGSIRAESWGGDYSVVWSVAGMCDTFTHGKWATLDAAKAAAQADYDSRIRSAITITSGADRAKLDKAAEALQGLVRYQKSILADVLTAHNTRGAGASEWMREDDRDFMRDLRAAFEVSAAVLAEIGGA